MNIEMATTSLRFVLRTLHVGGTTVPARILQQEFVVVKDDVETKEWRDIPLIKE
jgi:hypothetical protein